MINLPTDQYEEGDLVQFLTKAQEESKNDTISWARKALLSRSIIVDPAKFVHSKITKIPEADLQAPLVNSVFEFNDDGDIVLKSIARSACDPWKVLKTTNVSNTAGTANAKVSDSTKFTFGKVVQIRSPVPEIVLQLLVCLGIYFDLNQVLSTFLSGPSLGYCSAYATDLEFRRIWFFSIKYYYLALKEEPVYPTQKSGIFHETSPRYHIRRGSSSVVFGGHKKNESDSNLKEAPWRVLVISFEKRNTPTQFATFRNGIEAYLWYIGNEVSVARRSLRNLSSKISDVATPSDDILFNPELSKSLLFEEESFTKSHTYFWAIQSLRLINECITALILAWKMYDKMSFLSSIECCDKKSCSCYTSSSAGGVDMARRSQAYIALESIEQQMTTLAEMIEDNKAKQEEIKSLRDGLFNASAVREAQTTVEQAQTTLDQGRNIWVLTLISILFLPASFATSIFGMQSILPVSTTLDTFAVVMGITCGLTYFVVVGFVSFRWWKKRPKPKRNDLERSMDMSHPDGSKA